MQAENTVLGKLVETWVVQVVNQTHYKKQLRLLLDTAWKLAKTKILYCER